MRCLTIALLLAGCIPIEPGPRPIPPMPPGTCAEACARLTELGCDESKPTPGGASCVDVCENAEREGQSLNPGCVLDVTSCERVADCQQ